MIKLLFASDMDGTTTNHVEVHVGHIRGLIRKSKTGGTFLSFVLTRLSSSQFRNSNKQNYTFLLQDERSSIFDKITIIIWEVTIPHKQSTPTGWSGARKRTKTRCA